MHYWETFLLTGNWSNRFHDSSLDAMPFMQNWRELLVRWDTTCPNECPIPDDLLLAFGGCRHGGNLLSLLSRGSRLSTAPIPRFILSPRAVRGPELRSNNSWLSCSHPIDFFEAMHSFHESGPEFCRQCTRILTIQCPTWQECFEIFGD